MRTAMVLICVCGFFSIPIFAASETVTALGALKLLPKKDAKNLARIEAREGTPAPDRWYLIVYDSTDPNGLHEFVIAGKEIVASRAISQFVEAVKPEEMIALDAIKIDSDRAAKLAKEYAAANNIAISKINYELKKEGIEAAPTWKISCLDETGKSIAELTLTATKGTVVSHQGFATAPQSPEKKKKLTVYAESVVAPTKPTEDGNLDLPPAHDSERPGGIGQTFKNVGNTFKHFFTGHN